MTTQIQRHLKAEEFYQQVIALIPENVLDRVSETYVRGKLDAILTMGKIDGYLVARPFSDQVDRQRNYPDRLIEDWQRIVDSV